MLAYCFPDRGLFLFQLPNCGCEGKWPISPAAKGPLTMEVERLVFDGEAATAEGDKVVKGGGRGGDVEGETVVRLFEIDKDRPGSLESVAPA